uniref:bifunctional phosphoribosylaminoimidazolecarboxamide formyltransferase/IMP cyclohydrolase n=1 Tax=Pararhizobium sp. IMCC3301 TaxID=3067904 RepID=UPI0027420240|nr:bifunctional phosphoribosylaminoimidazolecarboxamide formyltransferase/IMP cyclohydrolase [Pararhizobium sp. IMCC3301]
MSAPIAKAITFPDIVAVKTALLSVSDKTDLIPFARALHDQGVELISTGGTYKAISDAGIAVRDISSVTGFPEIMDGRVKTLHPSVHGALLALRDDPDHQKAMAQHGISPIDLVVVNLYPFEKTVASGADYANSVENIDIGGPAMIRAAAKNHGYVCIVTDTADYEMVGHAIAEQGGLTLQARKKLAARAYARTARYDAAISTWFAGQLDDQLGNERAFGGTRHLQLRYGENPHQKAAFYRSDEPRNGVATAITLQGKELSYNNINDTDAAFELVSEFNPADISAIAIIKHANPCGVATAGTLSEAYRKALACDPVSAFGGIVALNQTLTADIAEQILKTFTEVIIAPQIDEAAKAVLARKPNIRVLSAGGLPDPRASGQMIRSVAGGLLVQSRDNICAADLDLKVVTKRAPTPEELADLRFAFTIAKHVKSNAIVYARDGATVGIGAGQMSRVDSTRIAARKSEDAAKALGAPMALTQGSVVASDAFFPFADGLLAAAEAGATAIIQPGGSMRDQEVIDAANAAGLAMVFTGVRHFRH